MTGTVLRVASLAVAALLGAGCAGHARLADVTVPAGLPVAVDLDATPFHPQTEHQCGPAALATVLGAAGHAATPAALASEIYVPGRAGSLQPEIVAALRARDLLPYPVGSELRSVLAEVAAGHPVLVLQQLGFGPWPSWHYAVVVGYDTADGSILLRSGTERRQALRAAVFDATWARGGRWGLVALEPGVLPADADLERYMGAAAGLEAVGRLDAAEQSYRAAAERWPDAVLPSLGLANVAAARGDWHEAERRYRELLATHPGQAAALNNRAEILRRLGCPNTARAMLAEGLAAVAADDSMRPALERTLAEIAADTLRNPADPAHCAGYATPR
ncbi:MAG TPA: PA2778 family cysteine peptidase [Steroidobacteraceae bacterium]